MRSARSNTVTVVPGAGELLRRGEAGRPRSDDGHALAGADRRQHRLDPSLGPGAVDDLDFDLLDRHRDPG